MSLFRTACLRTRPAIALRPVCARYSTTASEAVILPRLQADLKAAMRSKNKPALVIIRALQDEVQTASRDGKPFTSDSALFPLIQKKIKASKNAVAEYEAAKRDDLVSKEQALMDVLQKYSDEIPKVAESELDELVKTAAGQLEGAKRNAGGVMGRVMSALKGRAFDMDYLSQKIEEVIGKK